MRGWVEDEDGEGKKMELVRGKKIWTGEISRMPRLNHELLSEQPCFPWTSLVVSGYNHLCSVEIFIS